MTSALLPPDTADPSAPALTDLDNLFNYDNAVDDFLKDIPINNTTADNNDGPKTTAPVQDPDTEITIKKPRKPNPKLDSAALLSPAGLPRLRRITKRHLKKFRGKGHEFTDISRLLNTYQLWLDDLYPRAKFRDALAMVEKVGHEKRMQVGRREWLDGTKPGRNTAGEEEERGEVGGVVSDSSMREGDSGRVGLGEGSADQNERRTPGDDVAAAPDEATGNGPDDDELDVLLAQEFSAKSSNNAPQSSRRKRGPFDDEDDEDDLDALLAENAVADRSPPRTNGGRTGEDFADDEEALASMRDDW